MEWQPIETVPKQPEQGDVPPEFVVLLYDPDNDIDNRVQVGFWNNVINDWQTLFDGADLRNPTHWMPLPVAPVQPAT